MHLTLTLALLAAAPNTALTADLRAKDQAMADAVPSGDHKPWDAALTPDAVYVDESGKIYSRAELLESITPLPAGITGKVTFSDFQVRQDGDTAFVLHHDQEEENFYGQKLHAEYLTSETWLKRKGEWKLSFLHIYSVIGDPPAVTLALSALDEYTGHYTGGGTLAWVIERQGNQLMGGKPGKPLHPLSVEVRDVLFTPGQPRSRKIFARDAAGKIMGFVDRRDGTQDIHWTRVAKP